MPIAEEMFCSKEGVKKWEKPVNHFFLPYEYGTTN
jgi:hypothetical protein